MEAEALALSQRADEIEKEGALSLARLGLDSRAISLSFNPESGRHDATNTPSRSISSSHSARKAPKSARKSPRSPKRVSSSPSREIPWLEETMRERYDPPSLVPKSPFAREFYNRNL